MRSQTCREQRSKGAEPFVACVAVPGAASALNRWCRAVGDASASDHVSQYPVEPQMSVRVGLRAPHTC